MDEKELLEELGCTPKQEATDIKNAQADMELKKISLNQATNSPP